MSDEQAGPAADALTQKVQRMQLAFDLLHQEALAAGFQGGSGEQLVEFYRWHIRAWRDLKGPLQSLLALDPCVHPPGPRSDSSCPGPDAIPNLPHLPHYVGAVMEAGERLKAQRTVIEALGGQIHQRDREHERANAPHQED